MSSARATADTANARYAPLDWAGVDGAMRRASSAQPGEVRKYGFPRNDLRVTVNGLVLRPALALGSWLAFRQTGPHEAVAMGDLVLAEREVAPVMSRLQEGGVEQTALHNHLLGESPRVMYMHVFARGDPVKIAATVRAALALTGTPSAAAPVAAPVAGALDTAAIAAALGRSGRTNGGVYQVGVPRAAGVTMDGVEVPPAMGVATGINFQAAGEGRVAATGDFVLIASEVNPVLRALRRGGIQVTALHSHMLGETPRLFFMHFWGVAHATELSRGLRAALDSMNVAPAGSR